MSDILKNAVARAKVLRNVAIENAKTMLIESLDDKVEGILSNKLKSEMEDEDPDNLESTDDEDETFTEEDESQSVDDTDDTVDFKSESFEEDPDQEEITEEDESQPKDDTDVTDDFKAEGAEKVDTTSDDEGVDTELENIIRELDDENDELEDDETELSETEVSADDEFEDDSKVAPELEEIDGIENSDDDEEIDVDLTDEGIDDDEGDIIPEDDDPEDKIPEPKLESLKSQNQKLKVEVAKRNKVINKLVEQIEELNLFNYKLAHTTKLFKKYNLSNTSKMKVIETFDRAKTIREVKLIYATLAESYRGGSAPKVAVSKTVKSIKNINEVKGGASKSILSDSLFNATTVLTEGTKFTNRLATLANLNKKK